MPQFAYIALNGDGKEMKGALDAADLTDARRQLRERSLMPLSLELGKTGGEFSQVSLKSPSRLLWTRPRDKQFLFRQMALMIDSGHRVRKALDTCSDLVERDGLARSINRMVDSIDRGLSFSDALRAEGKLFPAFVPALIQAGERSGTLAEVLNKIAVSLERTTELRNTVVRAMVLPLITLVVALLVLTGIQLWLVPRLSEFLSRNGTDIHWTMQILIDLTEFMLDYGLWISGGLAVFAFALLAAYTTEKGRLFLDRVILSIPLFGPTIRLGEMSRLGGVGTLLVQAGLRPVDTLKVMADVTQNHAYRKRYLDAADDVLTGHRISTSLGTGIVPKLVTHMVSVSELSGGLDEVLDRIGKFYADEVETRISVLINTLVPAMTIFVAIVVGVIYLSLMLTVIGAYNSIR